MNITTSKLMKKLNKKLVADHFAERLTLVKDIKDYPSFLHNVIPESLMILNPYNHSKNILIFLGYYIQNTFSPSEAKFTKSKLYYAALRFLDKQLMVYYQNEESFITGIYSGVSSILSNKVYIISYKEKTDKDMAMLNCNTDSIQISQEAKDYLAKYEDMKFEVWSKEPSEEEKLLAITELLK